MLPILRTALLSVRWALPAIILAGLAPPAGAIPPTEPSTRPNEIYIPYKDLRETLERHGRGVFLPYDEFQRLWDQAHRGALPTTTGTPVPALIGAVRYRGEVSDDAAAMSAEIEFDVLSEEWCTLDLRLGDVAIRSARYVGPDGKEAPGAPLIHVTPAGHQLVVRGKGHYLLKLEFLKKLALLEGRTQLDFLPVRAPVATLDVTLPLGGADVKIEPLLAASTQPVAEGAERTRVQAFIAPVDRLSVSWAAKRDLAAGLAGMMEVEQRHVITLTRTSVSDSLTLIYALRHVPRERFEVRLPAGWRVLGLDAQQVQSWSVSEDAEGAVLSVRLYVAAKERYQVRVDLSRAMTGDAWTFDVPVPATRESNREQGFVAIRQPDGLRVKLTDREGMVQVDPGELPEVIRPGVLAALRFPTGAARLTASVARIEPRLSLRSRQAARIDDQSVQLTAALDYEARDAGVFDVTVAIPAGWQVSDVGPAELVDDYSFGEVDGRRTMRVTLRRKVEGAFGLVIRAQRPREAGGGVEKLSLLEALDEIRGTYDGCVFVAAQEHLEVKLAESAGLTPRPVSVLQRGYGLPPIDLGDAPLVMAFEFRDRGRGDGAAVAAERPADEDAELSLALNLERKKTRITATASTLVDFGDALTRLETILSYDVRYSDIEEVAFKVPAVIPEDRLIVTGELIREKRVVPDAADPDWRHWRVTLTQPTRGRIDIRLRWDSPRTSTQPDSLRIDVPEIYPEGALEHHDGQIIVRKTENFQVEPVDVQGLEAIDLTEVKQADHRNGSNIAFKYNRPPFKLGLQAMRQEFQEIADLVVDRVLIEQVVSREGDVTSRAVYAVQSGPAPHLRIELPAGAKLLSHAWVNGRSVVPQTQAGSTQTVLIPLSGGAEAVRRSVVELMYAQSQRGAALSAPGFAKGTPVQETHWIVWTPTDMEAIWHDTSFASLTDRPLSGLRSSRTDVGWQAKWVTAGGTLNGVLATDGTPYVFRRLGGRQTLGLTLIGRNAWRGLVNVAWIVLALAGLKLGWSRRAMVGLAIVIVGALIGAIQPLFVAQVLRHGAWGLGVLGIAWIGGLVFFDVPRWWATRRETTPVPATPAVEAEGGADHA
ncbi:MAG: hypothetical protein HUU22_16815 [Phycisphaerae bacterium]|nr:hypothetical protein [Phycisphaerae bacterium]NUQ47683.1 hypothetical protein [Phycisphaerae bacterium]